MDSKQRSILEHIGRYTLTLRKVVESLYADDSSPNSVLSKLVRDGLVQRNSSGLDGNYSYYQLTSKGAKLCNVPPNRARPKEAKGLALDLAALWFSCMGDKNRKRLTTAELKTLFGAPKGANVVHVAQEGEAEETTIFRVFAPSAGGTLRSFLPTLRKSAFDCIGDEKILRWAERGSFQLAVLVHSDERRDDLSDLIKKEEFPDILIHVDVVPTPSNPRQFISSEKEME